jgi:hypothetical protein
MASYHNISISDSNIGEVNATLLTIKKLHALRTGKKKFIVKNDSLIVTYATKTRSPENENLRRKIFSVKNFFFF